MAGIPCRQFCVMPPGSVPVAFFSAPASLAEKTALTKKNPYLKINEPNAQPQKAATWTYLSGTCRILRVLSFF